MARQVSVRMYNVGFGDCFLVTFTDGQHRRKVLIDCGTHPQSTGSRRAERDAVPTIMDDLAGDGKERHLDVVVMTHRHKDHVSGFERPEWATVDVGDVWMPWTENPRDDVANGLRERQAKAADALSRVATLLPLSDDRDNAMDLLGNSLANEDAMKTLQTGFAGLPQRRYLAATPEILQTPALPGVKVHVLGPSRDEAVIKHLEPPSGEAWLALADAMAGGDQGRRPFDQQWSIPYEQFMRTPDFEDLRPGGQIIGTLRQFAANDLFAATAGLDKVLNGTSLMLVFELGDLLLLFPGDAQWGTWQMVLDNPATRELVSRARFYKVGHHGSYNATPKSFVNEVLAEPAWAAVPVAKVKRWNKIPNSDLLKALGDRHTTIVESDQPPTVNPPANVTVRGDISIDLTFGVGPA